MSEKHLTFSKLKGWEVPNMEYLRSHTNWNEKELEALIESDTLDMNKIKNDAKKTLL